MIEIGAFVVVVILIIGIALPIFYVLNDGTRLFNQCVELQADATEQLNAWKTANGIDIKDTTELTAEQLAQVFPNGVPCCPKDGASLYVAVRGFGAITCKSHQKENLTAPTKMPSEESDELS